MKRQAVIEIKRTSDMPAGQRLFTFAYETDEEYARKREQIRELLSRVRFGGEVKPGLGFIVVIFAEKR